MDFDRAAIAGRLLENRAEALRHFDAPETELLRSYAPGKWTAVELLAHIADCEFINLWRFSRAAAEPGKAVEVFEEGDWAAHLDYRRRPVSVSRGLFLGARDTLLDHIRNLSDERLRAACRHPEKGLMPAWRWARLAVNHAGHHLGQVAAARAGRPWVKPELPDAWEYGAAARPE